MKHWTIREISTNEWHVIETRFINEPEYILTRCTGPVPAGEIVIAMFLAQSLSEGEASIHNTLGTMKGALDRFKEDRKRLIKGE